LASIAKPTLIEIKDRNGEVRKLDGVHHHRMPTLLAFAQARDKDGRVPPIYLHGPAGTGKTTAAAKLAEALGLEFYFNGAIDSEYKLSGFVDAGGTFRSRPFFEAYSKGGVYLFDELDSSMPSAVLAFNAALANGHADFPTGKVERHPDCIILAAGNTTLRGDGNSEGFQRVEMDAAFRDRFVFLDWPLDESLEDACTPKEHKAWLVIVRKVRANVKRHGIKKADVTPRATFSGIALLQAGVSLDDVIASTLRKGLPETHWKQAFEGVRS
jgi:DNA polymerase III delta prime subunit